MRSAIFLSATGDILKEQELSKKEDAESRLVMS